MKVDLSTRNHPVQFKNFGGHYQLALENPEDLLHLLTLADGRWMATSCPSSGLRIDSTFLRLLDADGTGRIVSDEVRAAVRWVTDRLQFDASWKERQSTLPLRLINKSHPDTSSLESIVVKIQAALSLENVGEIELKQVREYRKIAAQAVFNGDGIIPAESVSDAQVSGFIRDLIGVFGGVKDASGRPGVDEMLLDQFHKEATAYIQWYDQGQVPEAQETTAVAAFGGQTAEMYQAIDKVKDKIEQFFAQCALFRFDQHVGERLDRLREEEMAQFDYTDRQAIDARLRQAPLAQVNSDGLLPLDKGINEYYYAEIAALREKVVHQVIGTELTQLDAEQWKVILQQFSAYAAWLKAKPATKLESLDINVLRAYLQEPYVSEIRDLIVRDKAVSAEVQQVDKLEKLILFHQWLFEFANNFVSFPRLFSPDRRAIFEVGRVVLEGRDFVFVTKVENRDQHVALAKNSGIFLLYFRVTGPNAEDNFDIVVPVTRGNAHGFYIGRRGVFFGVDGRELDAQVVQIVENPVSFWQLMLAPLRYFQSIFVRRFEQMNTSLQKETETAIGTAGTKVESTLQTGVRQVSQTQPGTETPAPNSTSAAVAPAESSRRAGNVRDVLIGVGFLAAGLGTAFKFLTDTARQLINPQILLMVLLVIFVTIAIIGLVTALGAWFKLRRRDLGGVLQASGWAINGRMRLTRSMARLFTQKITIPHRAVKRRRDLIPLFARQIQKQKSGEVSRNN